MKRFVIPVVMAVVMSALLIALFWNVDLLPPLASQQGVHVDTLLRALFILASVVFSLVISFIMYSLVAFRRRPGDMEDAKPVHGNVPLEIFWTAIPLVIVLVLGGLGTRALLNITRAPSQEELVVEVTGYQFAWSFKYPKYGFTSLELVLPIQLPALFRIEATDVIHSFWIPEFRIKTDAIPGMSNEQRITPIAVGEYQAFCSELCGTGHSYMTAPVKVVERDAFEAWVEEQQAAAQAPVGGAEQGELTYRQFCATCHTVDGTKAIGPSFMRLFGDRRAFEDGTGVVADEAYVRLSILDPGERIVQGYPNVMPPGYADQLSDEQISGIIEFMRTLQ